MTGIRIVLAEDHILVRTGFKMIINAEPDLVVVGEAGDGEAALTLIQQLQPDVAIIDLNMPIMSGVELATALKPNLTTTRLLILSANEDPRYVRLLLQLGASGYLLKRSTAEELMLAIHVIARGGRYLAPNLGELFIKQEENVDIPDPATKPVTILSDREKNVLRMIAEGLTNKEIAASLDVSIKTIETYKSRAMQKLELRGRTDIVRYAIKLGWLRTP